MRGPENSFSMVQNLDSGLKCAHLSAAKHWPFRDLISKQLLPTLRHKIVYSGFSSTVYPFFSRTPYFRVFHGWRSVRKNKMTANSANWGKFRKARLSNNRRRLQGQGFIPMGEMHTTLSTRCHYVHDSLTAVCVQYFIGM